MPWQREATTAKAKALAAIVGVLLTACDDGGCRRNTDCPADQRCRAGTCQLTNVPDAGLDGGLLEAESGLPQDSSGNTQQAPQDTSPEASPADPQPEAPASDTPAQDGSGILPADAQVGIDDDAGT